MKNLLAISILMLCMIGLQGCTTTGTATGDRVNGEGEEVRTSPAYRDLADYLRRMPGVRITGSGQNIRISIRDTGAAFSADSADTRPLFVVDGQVRGTSYYEVNRSIDINEVANVRVLTGSDAAAYGMRGANGVILIELKR